MPQGEINYISEKKTLPSHTAANSGTHPISRQNTEAGWVTVGTRNLMNSRDEARDKAKNTQIPADWITYRKLRNICTSSLLVDKKCHYRRQFEKFGKFEKFEQENYSSKLYKLTKYLLGWNNSSFPVSFLINGQPVNAPQKMANILLDTFPKKVENVIAALPPITDDPHKTLKAALEKWGDSANRREKFCLREISIRDI